MTLLDLETLSIKHPIIFYDGVCNLCDGFVNFIIRQDDKAIFKFCALQSELGLQVREKLDFQIGISSVIALDKGQYHTHSEVGFLMARRMGGLWNVFAPFYYLPRSFRDLIYNWIARNRYRWFGQKDACELPSEEIQARFIL